MADRISSLPDELLHHVLSNLTTKEAALTSVLTKRWRKLFVSVPKLDVDESFFLNPEEGKLQREEIERSFLFFVSRVLTLQGDSPIEKFSLKYITPCADMDLLKGWIHNVLERGVLEIDLFINNLRWLYYLPSEILMSKTLVKLKIGCDTPIIFNKYERLFLPMLKTLILDSIWFYGGQLQKVITACPVLEELDMSNIIIGYGEETVSSATLKTLIIKASNPSCAFLLDTQNLVCLKYSELVAEEYLVLNLESLVEAHIKVILTNDQHDKLRTRSDDWVEDDVLRKLGKVQKLFRGICNVQKLYLSHGSLQVLALCCQTMPVFNNLTFLDIDIDFEISWQTMPVLLRNCPQLETLVIKCLLHCVTDECGDACRCIFREDKGHLLASCPVKRFEIREFDGLMIEFEMIKHFLDYFLCLKEMGIYTRDGSEWHPQLNAEMFMLFSDLSGRCRCRNVELRVHCSSPAEWNLRGR